MSVFTSVPRACSRLSTVAHSHAWMHTPSWLHPADHPGTAQTTSTDRLGQVHQMARSPHGTSRAGALAVHGHRAHRRGPGRGPVQDVPGARLQGRVVPAPGAPGQGRQHRDHPRLRHRVSGASKGEVLRQRPGRHGLHVRVHEAVRRCANHRKCNLQFRAQSPSPPFCSLSLVRHVEHL